MGIKVTPKKLPAGTYRKFPGGPPVKNNPKTKKPKKRKK